MKCAIVRDLLPIYLDHLTSEESNYEIENHMQTCDACREYYDEMSDPKPVILPENPESTELKKDIDLLKSFKKRKRNWILTICIVAAALIILVYLLNFHMVSVPYEKAQPETLVSDTSMKVEHQMGYGGSTTSWCKGILITSMAGKTSYGYLPVEIRTVTIDGKDQLIAFFTSYKPLLDYIKNRDTFEPPYTSGIDIITAFSSGELYDGTPVSELNAIYYLEHSFERVKKADNDTLINLIEKYGHLTWNQETGNVPIYSVIQDE